jgi:hypothetical protein
MNLGRLATVLLLALAFAPAAHAATGELLVVIGNQVNLRQGPGTQQPIVTTMNRGQMLIELERREDWFRVDLGQAKGTGWVHASLVAPVSKGLGTGGGKAFGAFRQALEAENRRVFDATGVYPFVATKDLGDATVTVTPSEAWLANAGDLREQALRLHRLWKRANGGDPSVLVVNDAKGNVFVTVEDVGGETLVTTHY